MEADLGHEPEVILPENKERLCQPREELATAQKNTNPLDNPSNGLLGRGAEGAIILPSVQ